MPPVMVHEYTRHGTDGLEPDTRLPVMIDPLTNTLSNRLLVHVVMLISPELAIHEVRID